MSGQKEITYYNEILRKGIHLLSLGIPIIYSFVDKLTGLWLLAPVTIVFVAVDILSHFSGFMRKQTIKYFGSLMREHELRSDKFMLNGASYVLLSACLCVLVFPKIIAITAFSILIVSDICAALFGRKFGKHKFLDKSLEGTAAFVFSAWVVVFFIGELTYAPTSYFVTAGVAAIIGGVIENISIRMHLDDNFSIPASIGLTMWAMVYLFFQADSYLGLIQ